MQLPVSLRSRLEDMLTGVSTQELSRHYESLSERYRRQSAATSLQIQNRMEALAYAASRMPATYGAVVEVCTRIRELWPDFYPQHLLDLGAGPGTATLAALDIWPELGHVELVEPNPHLSAIAKELLPVPANIQPATLSERTAREADLVMLSYVLNEIPPQSLAGEIEKLWSDVRGALVIIEPGTPLGYQTILTARETLMKNGAHIAAPCPHLQACPLRESDRWCHFSVRIDRTSMHRRIKGDALLGYEDEKFSYLVCTRQKLPYPQARIIGNPHGKKIVELELCTREGKATTQQLTKRDSLYKAARKADWGDAI